jgi:surface polysaccharide O-acyltransferase-like enzyme
MMTSFGGQGAASTGSDGADHRRIDSVRVVLIAALVFLHYGAVYGTGQSPFRGYHGQPFPIASFVVSFVLFLAFTAVPLLAAISGWLFFRGSSPTAPPPFLRLWRKRLVSLALPFLLWSSAAVVGAMALRLVNPAMFAGSLGEPGSLDALRIANAVIGLTEAPLAVQFWFVRDLLLAIALSPLVWFCAARAPLLSLALLATAWLTDQTFGVFLRLDTFAFFWLGATLAIHRVDVTPNGRLAAPLTAAFLLAVTARTLAPWATGVVESVWLDLGSSAMRVLGVAAVWSLSDALARGPVGRLSAAWAPYAFFVYCAHYPLILYLKTALGRLWGPQGDIALIAHYLATVALTFVIVAAMARLLGRVSPRALDVLSGGRLGTGAAADDAPLTASKARSGAA